jgi:hypothetical protein
MSRRRRLLWLSVAAAAIGTLVGVAWPRVADVWRVREARQRGERLYLDWAASLAQGQDPSRSYVAVSGPSASAWSEVLSAAGLPCAAIVDEQGLTALPAGYRLVVVPWSGSTDAAALASAGRAVLLLEPPDQETTAPAARFEDGVELPLAGVRVRALAPDPDERPFLTSDGTVLGTVKTSGPGLLVRLGLDLGAHLVRMRLGLPSRAGRDLDGNGELQPADLLDAIPDRLARQPWADLAVDRLLALVAEAWPGCALPRTRGLPVGIERLVVLTSDQDYASDVFVELMAARLEERGARTTFLLTDPLLGSAPDLNRDGEGRAPFLSAATAASLVSRGFGLGVHPFPRIAGDLSAIAASFARRTGMPPRIYRNHHLRWPDYDSMPKAAAEAGVMLDLNLMPVSRDGGHAVGFPGGSARPVRMTDAAGALLPLLQQPTSVDDYSLRIEESQAREKAALELGRLSLEALEQAHRAQAPLVVNSHPMLHAFSPRWLDPLLAADGVQVVAVDRWLEFVVRRRRSKLALPACDRPVVELETGVVLRP